MTPDDQALMLAFQDELVKTGANPALEVARKVIARPGMVPWLAQRAVGLRGAAGGAGQWLSRVGKRQLHGFTGWTPGGRGARGLRSIGGGASEAIRGLQAAEAKAVKPGILSRVMHGQQAGRVTRGARKAKKQKILGKAEEARGARVAAEKMGLTSLPGWGRAMVGRAPVPGGGGPVQALKAGLGAEWKSGAMGKAMIGLPVAFGGYEALKPTQPGGPGKAERVAKSMGEFGWAMGLPIAPAIAASHVLGKAFGAAGRGAGKLTSRKKKPPLGTGETIAGREPEPGGGQTQPIERITTPAAMGQPPADVIS